MDEDGVRVEQEDVDADAPLGRGALDEVLRPPAPFEVTPLLLLAAVRDENVLPGVPLS